MAAVTPNHTLQRLLQLQASRGRRPADASIAGPVLSVADSAQRTQRRLGELAELWQELLPRDLVQHTALAGFRGGVLQVTTDSAATSFELDRLLRGGIEAQLRRRFRGTLVRIRMRVEPLDPLATAKEPAGRPQPARLVTEVKATGRSSRRARRK
jgi:hypothetical protein